MAELAVVRRYARALFDTAVKSNALDRVEEDLKGVHQIFRSVPTIGRALGAPTIAASRKKQLMEQAFGQRVSPLTLRFLTLALDRRRQDILRDIYPEFVRLANQARNILPVTVQSAVPLTDPERDQLVQSLAARTGKTIRLSVDVEPALIGGMIVRMGDTVIDGSVRSKLQQLHQRLAAGAAWGG
jgi:F-type H+-transporting ATPase subunit delta